MSFLHPQLALAAGVAALIPIIVHLLNRRRHRRVRWAAMGFLLAATRRRRRRIRLEHWLLLLLRAAVVLLLGLAVARPVVARLGWDGWAGSNRHHILLIDNSLSASLNASGDDGEVPRPPAVAAALELLGAFAPGDEVSVICAARPAAAVIDRPAFDRLAVRETIADAPGTLRATDLSGAFTHAAKLIEESPAAPGNRIVYLISDQARSAWQTDEATARAAQRLAETDRLVLVSTVQGSRANLAVTTLGCTDRLPSLREPVRLSATVANFSGVTAVGATAQVRLGDRIVRSIALDPLAPGEDRTVAFSAQAPAPGTQVVEVRLQTATGDALAADDARQLSLEVVESIPVLLVDGQPGSGKFAGETGYVATAMAPAPQTGRPSLLVPKTITELELPGEVLDTYRLICLGNVARLSPETWHRLEAYTGAGGGLLVCLGDAVDTENYNHHGYRDGQGLLPARLGLPTGDAASRETFVTLRKPDLPHPALSDFASSEGSGLFLNSRIYRLVPAEPHAATATTLLTYSNGLPALIERSYGQGKVCLFTTSANMAWNNLPARGDYVALVWSLASYLGGGGRPSRNLEPGDDVHEPLDAEWVSHALHVVTPDGRTDDARLEVADGDGRRGFAVRYGPVEQPGTYTVTAGNRQVHFCANVAPQESDLTIMNEAELRRLLKCPLTYVSDLNRLGRAAPAGGGTELAQTMQYAVLLALVIETWLAMRLTYRS